MTKKEFGEAIERAFERDGTTYLPLFRLKDGRLVCIVLGWEDGYEEGEIYQRKVGDKFYTLCGKIAVNVDDLQCDFDIDWYMPYDDKGEVYDTCIALSGVNDYEFFINSACDIVDKMNRGELKV